VNARELAMGNEALLNERDRQLDARRKAKARTAPKRAERVAKKRNEEERDAAFYEKAKREAADRSRDVALGGPRCEAVDLAGRRCGGNGHDPDHVVGGAFRKDCERLGSEGLMVLCRTHHNFKHASAPSRAYWLDMGEQHALRHGYRGLYTLVARARAKYEAKHPLRPPSHPPETHPEKES
jgi:hypothetical protein